LSQVAFSHQPTPKLEAEHVGASEVEISPMVSCARALFPRGLRRFGRGKTEARTALDAALYRCMRANHRHLDMVRSRMRWARLTQVGVFWWGPFPTPHGMDGLEGDKASWSLADDIDRPKVMVLMDGEIRHAAFSLQG
jgi:hypothetical protein